MQSGSNLIFVLDDLAEWHSFMELTKGELKSQW